MQEQIKGEKMANYKIDPKKERDNARDIALDKLEGFDSHRSKEKKPDKIKGRPKNPFVRFCEYMFPQKDDAGGEKARKIVFLLAIAVFCCTLIIPITQLMGMKEGADLNEQIASIAGSPTGSIDVDLSYQPFNTNKTTADTETSETFETEEINVTPLVNTPLDINFEELKAINPDTRAWVKVTGTPINNVVCQSDDNKYYLDHDFYGNESISGTIFSSYKNKWDGTDDNIVLVGHNMISGDFFALLGHYVPNDVSREPLAFYKVHPTVMLATPEEGSQTYKIFAGMLVNTDPEYGEVFKYINKTKFKDKDDFNQFIIDVMDRSWFFTDVDITYGDQLVTMSTCYWPVGRQVDTRWVILARKVRPGESEYVDVSAAERNYQVKLFDYYYEVAGGQWYGSVWDKSKLLSYDG